MKNKYYQNLEAAKLKQPKKLELGLIDDLKKVISTAMDFEDAANDAYNDVISRAKKATSESKDGQKWLNKVITEYKKVQKSAKDLGVKLPNEIDSLYKSAVKAGATFNKIIKATSNIK